MDDLLWLVYPLIGMLLMAHPQGRRALWLSLVVLPIAIVLLMVASEPDI